MQSVSRPVLGQLKFGESAYGAATTLAAPVEVGASHEVGGGEEVAGDHNCAFVGARHRAEVLS